MFFLLLLKHVLVTRGFNVCYILTYTHTCSVMSLSPFPLFQNLPFNLFVSCRILVPYMFVCFLAEKHLFCKLRLGQDEQLQQIMNHKGCVYDSLVTICSYYNSTIKITCLIVWQYFSFHFLFVFALSFFPYAECRLLNVGLLIVLFFQLKIHQVGAYTAIMTFYFAISLSLIHI